MYPSPLFNPPLPTNLIYVNPPPHFFVSGFKVKGQRKNKTITTIKWMAAVEKKEWKGSYRERLIENKDKHSEFHRWMMQSITGTTRTACSSVLPAFVLPALCVFRQKRYLWWDLLIFNQIKKNRPADSCTGVGGPGGNGKQHSPTREKKKKKKTPHRMSGSFM